MMDKYELCDLLTTGQDAISWNISERIQKLDKALILDTFELVHRTLKKNGLDDYVRKLLHSGFFESTKNPFNKLVSGYGYDERFFKSAPETLLKTWIAEFASFLGKQRERTEKSLDSGSPLMQAWESFRGGMN